MPFEDGFYVPEDHPVFAVLERLWHRDLGVLQILARPHELDVLNALLQVLDVRPLGLQQLLQSVISLLNCFPNGFRVGVGFNDLVLF